MVVSRIFENINVFWKLWQLQKNFPFRPDQVKATQLRNLRRLLVHAYAKFDFYKDIMDDAGFDPCSLRHVEEIERLPVINKEMYRDFVGSVVEKNPDVYNKKYHVDGTSGSTGMPLKIYRSWGERAYLKAKFLRVLFLNGYNPFDVTYWIVSPHRILAKDSVFQKLGIMPRYSASYLDTTENMLKGYIKANPNILIGNKAQLVQMALYVKKNNIAVKRPKLCVCYAETLDANSKLAILEVFGDDNFIDTYGAIEVGNLAFQLKGNDFYFINHDTNIIELDDNGNMNQQKGYCIITDLHIRSFPVIRYELGDWLEMDKLDGLPVLKSIRGRIDDWITWKDGSRIPFHFFYEIMERRPEISQFRIIQETYDFVRVLVVPKQGENISRIETILLHDLKTEVRSDITYEIEFTDFISPDPTGKLRMVISKVSNTVSQLQNTSFANRKADVLSHETTN